MPKTSLTIYNGNYVDLDDFGLRQFSFNMFPVINEQPGSMTPARVLRTPGLTEFSDDLGSGTYAGYATQNGDTTVLYVNYGLTLYRVPSAGGALVDESSPTNLTGAGYASMAFNASGICAIVKGGNAYFFDRATTTLSTITDLNFIAIVGTDVVLGVVYIDGYFVFATETTLFTSSLETVNKGRDFDTNDTLAPLYKGDEIRSIAAIDGLLWVTKQITSEVYDNTGAAGFPFDRIDSLKIDVGGCVTGRSVEIDKQLYFLGRSNNTPYAIYRMNGGVPEKISTDVIDKNIATSDCDLDPFAQNLNQKLFAMDHDGRKFLGLFLEILSGITLVYDITESRKVGRHIWHRRGVTTGVEREYWVKDTINAYNKNLAMGSRTDFFGVAEIDTGESTEFATDVVRYCSTEYVSNGMDEVFINELLVRGKRVDCDVCLLMSVDRGATYLDMGTINMEEPVIKWERLGTSMDYTFIISNSSDLTTVASGNSDLVLYDAWVDIR